MSEVRCHWLVLTNRCRLSLRRFRWYETKKYGKCAEDGGYCEARVPFGERDAQYKTEGKSRFLCGYDYLMPGKSDPRWPKKCSKCSYQFEDPRFAPCDCEPGCTKIKRVGGDNYQVFFEQIWRRDGTDATMVLEEAAAGAMWDAWWLHGVSKYEGADGRALMVKLPDGSDWTIDDRWTRTGEPPIITVQPSIKSCGYHGFLIDGVLRSC